MSRLKWSKRNALEIARDFSQRGRTYLYSDIEEPKKETDMVPDTCIGMTPKDLRQEIKRLVTEIGGIQKRVSELSAKLIIITKGD